MVAFPVRLSDRHRSNSRVYNGLYSGRIPYTFCPIFCWQATLNIADITGAAATTQEIDLSATYPTDTFPANVVRWGPPALRLVRPFTGGSVSACTAALGDTGDPDGLHQATSVFSGSGWLENTPAAAEYDFRMESSFSPTLTLATTGGNVADLTAGEIEITIPYTIPPGIAGHEWKAGRHHRENGRMLNLIRSGRMKHIMTGIFFYRQRITLADFTPDADADQTLNLNALFPNNVFPSNVWRLPGTVYVHTGGGGGGVTALAASLGIQTATSEIMTSQSVFTGVSGFVFAPTATAYQMQVETALAPTVRLQTSGGSIDDLTALDIEVVIPFIPLPNTRLGRTTIGANRQLLNSLRSDAIPYAWSPMLWHRTRVQQSDLTGSSPYTVNMETFANGSNAFPDNVMRQVGTVIHQIASFGAASTIDIGDTGDPNGICAGLAITGTNAHAASLSAQGDVAYFESAYRPVASITAGSIAANSALEISIPFNPLPTFG